MDFSQALIAMKLGKIVSRKDEFEKFRLITATEKKFRGTTDQLIEENIETFFQVKESEESGFSYVTNCSFFNEEDLLADDWQIVG